MKILVCNVLRLVFICLISGVLGATGITLTDWRFWLILGSALGLYTCGCILGKESQ
jgi:hypothetical protein